MGKRKLSNNFSLAEFESSPTANRLHIDNSIPSYLIENIQYLVDMVMQPCRTFLGTSINITSGYRSPELNKAIGGAASSQHQVAQAADFVCHNKSLVFEFIRQNLDFDQLIWEFGDDKQPQWIHVSIKKENNRRQVLKAYKKNGRTKYKNIT